MVLNPSLASADMSDNELGAGDQAPALQKFLSMAGSTSMQEPSLGHMLRGSIKTAVERFARPATPGSAILTSETGIHLSPWLLGQIVTARVLEHLSSGRYLIALDGTTLEAVGPKGLSAGGELTLRLEQLIPHLSFRMLSRGQSGDTAILHILRTHLPNYVTAADAVLALRQEWQHLNEEYPGLAAFPHTAKLYDFLSQLLPEEALPSAEHLAAYIRDGGLFYEAKLLQQGAGPLTALREVAEQDVKGLLLGALQELEMAPAGSATDALLLGIRKHLDHVESHQALHLLAHRHDEAFPLQIPVWLGQALSTIMLAVAPDDQNREDGQGGAAARYRVLFLLDLDGLGQTRIDVQATKQSLSVVFYLGQQEALPVFQDEISGLESALRTVGFSEVHIDARPLAVLPPKTRQTFDTGVTVPLGVNLVDVKV